MSSTKKEMVDDQNVENVEVKLKPKSSKLPTVLAYPTGVYFCLFNEGMERFTMYGIQAVLTFYLLAAYDMSKTGAMIAYHAFAVFSYGTGVLGSILADGYVGPYKVVIYGSLFYVTGMALLTLSSFTVPGWNGRLLTSSGVLGLILISIGAGARKPCLAAFAADQFPAAMAKSRKQFFSILYLFTYGSAMLAQLLTPVLRGGVKCMGRDTCYPMAFGVMTAVIAASLVTFLVGSFWYVNKSSRLVTSNVVADACQCVGHAIKKNVANKSRKKSIKTGNDDDHHWLDSAAPVFGKKFVSNLKDALKVCAVLAPTTFIWCLIFQSGSTFVVQGSLMDSRLANLTVLPDQLVTTSSIFAVVLIVLLETCLYPLLAKINVLQRPLSRIGLSYVLSIASFLLAGFIQLQVDKSIDQQGALHGYTKLTVVNMADCAIEVQQQERTDAFLKIAPNVTDTVFVPDTQSSHSYNFLDCTKNATDASTTATTSRRRDLNDANQLAANNVAEILAFWSSTAEPVTSTVVVYRLDKPDNGNSRYYILVHPDILAHFPIANVTFEYAENGPVYAVNISSTNGSFLNVKPALIGSNVVRVKLTVCTQPSERHCSSKLLAEFQTGTGSVGALFVNKGFSVKLVTLVEANSLSLMWQTPQYCLLVAADMFLSTGGVEFAYTESAPSMKSMLQAYRLVTATLGNVLYMGVSSLGLRDPAAVFFFWAAFCALSMAFFVFMTTKYEYVAQVEEEKTTTVSTTAAEAVFRDESEVTKL